MLDLLGAGEVARAQLPSRVRRSDRVTLMIADGPPAAEGIELDPFWRVRLNVPRDRIEGWLSMASELILAIEANIDDQIWRPTGDSSTAGHCVGRWRLRSLSLDGADVASDQGGFAGWWWGCVRPVAWPDLPGWPVAFF